MDDASKKRRSSLVWDHFKKISDQKFVQCKHCQVKMKFHFSTSNMRKHLSSKHSLASLNKRIKREQAFASILKPDEACSTEDQTMSSQTLVSLITSKVTKSQNEAECINDGIVNVLVGDIRPINMVEGQHFKNLITMLAPPGYEVPSRRYFTDEICKLYDAKKSHVVDLLKTAKHIALTSDTWTSIRQETYMCLTAQFISKDFKRQHFMLSTMQVHGRHTAENLCEWIREITSEFNIDPSKIMAIVTDNEASILAATSKLKTKFGWKGIKCAAHTLQLVLKKGFAVEEVSAMLNSVTNLVAHYRKSEISSSALHDEYKHMHSGETLKPELLMDASTTWNSCLDMVQMLEKLQLELRAVLSDPKITNRREAPYWSINDCELFHGIVKLLEPFKTATAHLEGDNYITISSLKPLIKGLVQEMANCDDDSTALAVFKTTVAHAMTATYFTDILGSSDSVTIYDICYFLDPRYKLKSTSSQFRENLKAEIKKEMRSTLDIPMHTASNLPVDLHALVKSDASTSSKLHMLLVKGMAENSSDWSCDSGTAADSDEIESRLELELITYLNFPHLGISSASESVFRWWQEHNNQLPTLSQIFSKYFCIPGTVSKLRSRLTGEHVSALNFLHYNKFLL